MDVCSFIKAVLAQDENTIRDFFHKDAYVNWHCSNEHFTVDEFIIANCEYPGDWDGTIERVEVIGDLFITATKVYPQDLQHCHPLAAEYHPGLSEGLSWHRLRAAVG